MARPYGISSGQLYTWRRALLVAQPGVVARTNGGFASVDVAAAATKVTTRAALLPQLLPDTEAQAAGLIEIVLPNGSSVPVDAQMDEQTLHRVPGPFGN